MKYSFFKDFAAKLFRKLAGTPKAPKSLHQLHQLHQKLKGNEALQRIAKDHGDKRRLHAWMKSVHGGYAAKRQLVKNGKGHNTLAGIPA